MCLFAVVAVICSDELVGVCSIVAVVMIELELVVVMLPCYMVGLMLQASELLEKGPQQMALVPKTGHRQAWRFLLLAMVEVLEFLWLW